MNTKTHSFKNWLKTGVVAALALTAIFAQGQDYSTKGGDNGRKGHSTQPGIGDPGVGNLRWFKPSTVGFGLTLIRDNRSLSSVFTGGWNGPLLADEAASVFIPQFTGDPFEDDASGYDLTVLNGEEPTYLFTNTIAAQLDTSDPTVKQNGGDVKQTFRWTLAPELPVARDYALYVWLPQGPTRTGATSVFPQRFYVYEVLYGTGKRFVEVFDSYQAGTGWVRLGNGGRPSNRMFPYDGVTPIQIILHNTVPRLDDGTLSDTPGSTVVYADAVRAAPSTGFYSSTPIISAYDTITGVPPVHVVDARNEQSTGERNGILETSTIGRVQSMDPDDGSVNWTFVPLDSSEFSKNVDNTSAGVTVGATWSIPALPEPGFQGTNYLSAAIVNALGAATSVDYAPTLDDGTYEVWAYVPGSRGAENLSGEVRYEINEGGVTSVVTLNQNTARGWTRIGARRYAHTTATAPLTVSVLNYSSNVADLSNFAYADAIKFVGAVNLAIHSSPVQVRARVINSTGGTPTLTNVTLVAAEDGRIYCVDSVGNGDGTTRVYWAYPSIPRPNETGYTDPNLVNTEDGVGGIAEMPVGFDTSSALVQTIGSSEFLFIGSRNGRVYCIDMAGRGDMDFTKQYAGTTTRVWTYPNDFPAVSQRSNLGPIVGSVSYADTTAGPTIFVPASSGRLYALDAAGNGANKTTDVRWTYPPLNQPTLGEMVTTPAIDFGSVYIGTRRKEDGTPGHFIALDINNGNVDWDFTGTTAWDTTLPTGIDFVAADDFSSSPALVDGAFLGGVSGVDDTVYVANDNRFISALDAYTGAVKWTTDELSTTVNSGLTFTRLTVLNGAGGSGNTPIIMVPTADGRFVGLFALPGTGFGATNRFGTKRAWEYVAAGGVDTLIAQARGVMVGTDDQGFLYAFNQSSGSPITPGFIPGGGGPTNIENDISGDIFRDMRIKVVDKATYLRLRAGTATFAEIDTYVHPRGDPAAFDWGETVYIVAYRIPYKRLNPGGATVAPPVINFQLSVEGTVLKSQSAEAKKFAVGPFPFATSDPTVPLDGYAFFPFLLQGGGASALPPGSAEITASVTTSSLTDPARPQNVAMNNTVSQGAFLIANPLALVTRYLSSGLPDITRSIAYTTNANSALGNGSFDDPLTTHNESLLASSIGVTAHNSAASTYIGVVDRSLMTLIRGPGRGVDNIRIVSTDLEWQGGGAAVLKPISAIPFYSAAPLEDYPTQFPNISLDYPDIFRDRLRVTKDPNGSAENPLFNAVSLKGPTNVDDSVEPAIRTLVDTPFELNVSVQRFQPPNLRTFLDSGGEFIPAGYRSRMNVFVDSDGNGGLTRGGGRREAYRSLFLGASVAVDERFRVTTPTVDLGSLATSTAYGPESPLTNTAFGPVGSSAYGNIWRPFEVINEGNVNLTALRLAKATAIGAGTSPWAIFGEGNHDRAWLNSETDVHSTIGSLFAPVPQVVLPKARVTDRLGTFLSPNPIVRQNANLNEPNNRALLPGLDAVFNGPPLVAVSIPLGFPTGAYSQTMRVIEEVSGNFNEALMLDSAGVGLESYSDPGFVLKFNVRETRVTNSKTPNTANIEDEYVFTGAENFKHLNAQPTGFRDENGNLIVAFTSNRATWTSAQPTAEDLNPQNRIFVSHIEGNAPVAGQRSPLADLNGFTGSTANRWATHDIDAYPSTASNVLFPGDPIVANTMRFGFPAFPSLGNFNPLTGASNSGPYMAFVGEAQKQTPTGRQSENRVFIGRSTLGANGQVTLGDPVGLDDDLEVGKGKPSIVQAGDNATVFYSSSGTGQRSIRYATFNGTAWSNSSRFETGTGFENVTTPSLYARIFQGGGTSPSSGTPIIDVSFAGKLRGRANADIYLGRMTANNALVPQGYAWFPVRRREILGTTAQPGNYQAQGVVWNTRSDIELYQTLNGTEDNLEVDPAGKSTRVIDRTTGIIAFDSKLGGKVYLDPNLGTVRFTTAVPSKNAQLMLRYQARFLRVSGGGSAHANPSLLFDNRFIGEFSYWANSSGGGINTSDPVRSARYVFTYGKAASGGGQASRPFVHTVRPSIQLPFAIHTGANGSVTNLTITGNTSYYQVDPANGRVYFTDADEGRAVRVNYTGMDRAGNAVPGLVYPPAAEPAVDVQLMTERSEVPVSIEQAVNESQMTTFIDPFDFAAAGSRRPGLIWMLWTSTRAGGPDIYFQTIAPRYTPIAAGR